MTDKYDMDPHEHEAHAGDEQGHEAKAEAWPDDQPPVDDFADPGAEETATASEEMGASSPEEMPDAEPRKSSSLLPIVAGLGGLLFLGAVLYWQFGRSSSPIPSVPPPPPLQMTQATPEVPMQPKTDVAPKTSFAPADNVPAGTLSPSTSAGTAMPVVSSAAPATGLAPIPPSPNVPLSQTGSPLPISGDTETRLNNLAAQVGDLKKELDQATQQLGQMNTAMLSPSASGSAVLEQRLNKIEQQVEQMQHAAAPALASPTALPGPDSASQATEDAIDASVAKMAAHKESYRHKSTKKARTPKTARHTSHAAATKWVLRAAVPDEAWVAKDETSGELRHVRVGDELPGVGRVKTVHQVGNSWVIEGSTGSIR